MRLIDANALPIKTNQRKQYVLYTDIENAPTIDAVPVVNGRWMPINPKECFYRCSECSFMPIHKNKYCPNCGARMDGK